MRYNELLLLNLHLHMLILKPADELYRCNRCKELGYQPCYQCTESCDDCHVHEECADPPRSIFQSLIPGCDFFFYEQVRAPNPVCDGCGKAITGCAYVSNHPKKHHMLHPCCMKLPHVLTNEGARLRLKNEVSKKCLHCDSREVTASGSRGWSYVSDCGKVSYHIACVKEMYIENWRNPHTLALGVRICQDMVLVRNPNSAQRKLYSFFNKVKLSLKLVTYAVFRNPIASQEELYRALRA